MANPFERVARNLELDGKQYKYYSLSELNDPRVDELPYSIRILLESALRNCDNFSVSEKDVENILNWKTTSNQSVEIPFKPARVLMQDFTGVPAVVDLAALRDAMKRLGGDPSAINPLVPVDLVIDHSVQVDANRSDEALEINQEKEFNRNAERFSFLKWGSGAFQNLQIVPPGSGIVHQVNLEYLARVVFKNDEGVLYPDSLVGTDSHTTMINGLGVLGWGVGGIEAEASMLGQPMSMVLPKVVGYKLTGRLTGAATATDLVLTITHNLRKHGVVGKFVEFFGEGLQALSISDRATLANMAPEYGATVGFCPVDETSIQFLRATSRADEQIKYVEAYSRAQKLFLTADAPTPVYSDLLELDIATVVPCIAGPKRPQDRIALTDVKNDFQAALKAPRGFKGFAVAPEKIEKQVTLEYNGSSYELKHGFVSIAAITSCTNTSNPSVMLGAGLVAKKAVEAGLSVQPYVKTSLSPGSGVVTKYLAEAGLQPYLNQLGFNVVGYGCMTCIGNSGDLPEPVAELVQKEEMIASAVLSGNRNFEARVHPLVAANYLASPPLVVAYALAGTVNIDFESEPIGHSSVDGRAVFLRDIWPTQEEVRAAVDSFLKPDMFTEVYNSIKNGTPRWNNLAAPTGLLYSWDESSTYIHNPPFFQTMQAEPEPKPKIENAYVLLNLGDSITTDHISPAGNISRNSSAAKYLMEKGVQPKDFNSYGARRGNDEIMTRGTFANVRLLNKLAPKAGPITQYVPTGEVMDIFDAATKYKANNEPVIVFGGSEYGSGSSRDWAAKGPFLLGVKAVIAVSFERIHRSNLAGMGIIPLQFLEGENPDTLGLTGKERFTIELEGNDIRPGQLVEVKADNGKTFNVKLRFDTPVEIEYYRHGGILNYVLRSILKKSKQQ